MKPPKHSLLILKNKPAGKQNQFLNSIKIVVFKIKGTMSSSEVEASGQDEIITVFKKLVCKNDMAVPVAAMNSLVRQMKDSRANTWMELESELRITIKHLKSSTSSFCGHDQDLLGRTNISLGSGCDLFMKYVSRTFNMEDMVRLLYVIV